MRFDISPDQMSAAAGYIAREWGSYGYRIEDIDSPTHAVSLFHVVALDGSRFTVAADRWGNCRHADGTTDYANTENDAALGALVREMHEAAVAS